MVEQGLSWAARALWHGTFWLFGPSLGWFVVIVALLFVFCLMMKMLFSNG